MNQKLFQILYTALVEIATADAFFDESKRMRAIAQEALKQIATVQESKNEQE